MKATWSDIERALSSDTLEEKDKETLEAYSRVEPPPSNNPIFHNRFNDAKQRIRHRLLVMATESKKAETSAAAINTNTDLGLWFVRTSRLLREIRKKAIDAQKTKSKTATSTLKTYLNTDHTALIEIWPKGLSCPELSNLGRHIHFSQKVDFRDILEFDLPAIESIAEKHFLTNRETTPDCGFEVLLHPIIRASSYAQYRSGHLRDAVLNSIVGLCDHNNEQVNS